MKYKDIFQHGEARERANNSKLGKMTPEKKLEKGTKQNIQEELADTVQYCTYGIEAHPEDMDIYKSIMEHAYSAYEDAQLLNA